MYTYPTNLLLHWLWSVDYARNTPYWADGTCRDDIHILARSHTFSFSHLHTRTQTIIPTKIQKHTELVCPPIPVALRRQVSNADVTKPLPSYPENDTTGCWVLRPTKRLNILTYLMHNGGTFCTLSQVFPGSLYALAIWWALCNNAMLVRRCETGRSLWCKMCFKIITNTHTLSPFSACF